MIPKLIHQTAKTAEIGPKWRPLQKKLLELHPDWTYKLWTDEDNLSLIQERRPDLEAVYLGLPKPIMRADLIRYVYMEQFGGLYLDTDYQCLKPFDLLGYPIVLPRESEPDQPIFLGNALFASEPGHPFWTALLEDLRKSPPTSENTHSEDAVITQTGPGRVTHVWKAGFQNDSTIFIPQRSWFHPVMPRNNRALADILSNSETYAIHWCFGTWRALSPWTRLKNRIKKSFGR